MSACFLLLEEKTRGQIICLHFANRRNVMKKGFLLIATIVLAATFNAAIIETNDPKCSEYDIPRGRCRACGQAHLPGTPCPK